MNFLENIEADITPIEFEKLCIDLLMRTKGFDKLEDVIVEHNRIEETHDGTYQLDGYIEFSLIGVKHKAIIECKKHKNPIKREDVVILKDKVQSLAANKGILMASCGFQSGAIEYAKEHGLGLIQVIDSSILTIQASVDRASKNELLKRYLNMPKHSILMYDLTCKVPVYNLSNNLGQFEDYLYS